METLVRFGPADKHARLYRPNRTINLYRSARQDKMPGLLVSFSGSHAQVESKNKRWKSSKIPSHFTTRHTHTQTKIGDLLPKEHRLRHTILDECFLSNFKRQTFHARAWPENSFSQSASLALSLSLSPTLTSQLEMRPFFSPTATVAACPTSNCWPTPIDQERQHEDKCLWRNWKWESRALISSTEEPPPSTRSDGRAVTMKLRSRASE